MEKLHKKNCLACDGKTTQLNMSEIKEYLKRVEDWDVKNDNSESFYLVKSFKFKNFVESEKFVRKVGSIAEQEGHHPDIFFGWGYAKIKILTHAIKGLTESDFILAAKVDQI